MSPRGDREASEGLRKKGDLRVAALGSFGRLCTPEQFYCWCGWTEC